jgi:2-dehydro-3-deoxygalactonokinase
MSGLIAIDWGTSNLRASLLDAHAGVVETRSAPGGVMKVKDGLYAAELLALCGDWIDQGNGALIASGMIGSRQGWKEAPYLNCPSGLADAASQLTRVQVKPGVDLHIVPGLTCIGADGEHDVMRGEETQLWGAALPPGSCCVLPGTHSKWAWIGNGGTVERFATYMTGELYGLLTQHGILGRLMRFGESHTESFEAGVRLGLDHHANATHVIFSARTAGLMGRISAEGLPDYLSGILLGVEIGSARSAARTLGGSAADGLTQTVFLLGDDDLCSRYATALRLAGLASTRVDDGATTRGQWLVAQQAGFVSQTS